MSQSLLPDGGFVVCGIGSLCNPRLRLAGEERDAAYAGPFEILTLSGTVTIQGAHLHMSVAGSSGDVFGGHVVYGNEVRTTVELLLASSRDWALSRERDPVTGFLELVTKPTGSAEGERRDWPPTAPPAMR